MRRRVTSVVVGTNADLIVAFAELYIRPDDVVVDVTYGKGVFWRKYRHPGPFIAHDLALDGVDFTQLPEADGSVDVLVADPPHIAPGGRTTSTIPGFNQAYGLTAAPRTPAAVLELYTAGLKEWARAVHPGGIIAVKCSAGTTSRKKRWMHHYLFNAGLALGLGQPWDEMLLVRRTPGPQPPHRQQEHADNTHSYLLVFRAPTRRTTT